MNHEKLIVGLLLLIGVGLLAVPLSSAQFAGGDAGNNEDESSSDGSFSGGDADNNEDQFDGGDADNNEDQFDGGDADNNEDQPEEQVGEDPAPEDDISPARTVHVVDMSYSDQFNLQVDPENVAPRDTLTVSGQLTIDENAERDIRVLINERREATVTTDQNGNFETEVTAPEDLGTHTAVVQLDNIRERMEFQVGEGNGALNVGPITTSGETRAGQPIQICAEVTSRTDAEVTLYQNDQQVDTQTGQGNICFNPTLESGTNDFRIEATANGETAQSEITRTANGNGEEPAETERTAPTGGFLGSPTARLAAVGALIVALASAIVLFARRETPDGTLGESPVETP